MTYFKETNGGYILAIGTDTGGEEITAAEYDELLGIIRSKPARTETTDYRLKEDLTWEPYEVEPPDPDPELDGDEALEILLGGAE